MKMLLAWLVLCSALAAQVTTKTMSPGVVLLPYKMSSRSSSVRWDARQPFDLEFEEEQTSGDALWIIGRDGTLTKLPAGEFYSICKIKGEAGQTIVMSVFDFGIVDGNPVINKETFQVEFEGDPEPEPGPTPPDPPEPVVPDLDGFALVTWKKAAQANDPKAAQAQASVYESLAAKIAANGITTRQQAKNEWHTGINSLRLGSNWSEFGKWISGEIQRQGTTLDNVRNVFAAAAEGLAAVEDSSVGMFPMPSPEPIRKSATNYSGLFNSSNYCQDCEVNQ